MVCFSCLCGHFKGIPNMYGLLSLKRKGRIRKGTALKKTILRDKRIHLQLYSSKCGSVRIEGEKGERERECHILQALNLLRLSEF